MIYARQPTVEERRELQRMTRQAAGQVGQRARLILRSSQGDTAPELAPLFKMGRARVRFWLRRVNLHGPAVVYDDRRCGRPCQVSPRAVEAIVTRCRDHPRHTGYLATRPTVARLRWALLHRHGTA
jgi:transposase